jgi:hypothetical protein
MNKLTSVQRKLVYLGGIILLSIPVILLGRPAAPASAGSTQADAGGKLAQLRAQYELGEQSLGKVDAASSTMNLLLLGFRGIATSILWMDAQEQQKNKDWAALRATTESIILLQPHFQKVWHFQGWNLAYNVSAEWDLVRDRYYWVKEGIKFFKKGVARNDKYAELYWFTGDTIGKKIGRSDEWKQFRRYYRDDPDKENYPSGLDQEINPNGKDNYLEAKVWFQRANDVVDQYGHEQHIMARVLARSYPARSQLDYAGVLQREGSFDEVTRNAWAVGYDDWTQKYGRELVVVETDPTIGPIRLELTADEIEDYRRKDAALKPGYRGWQDWVDHYRKMTNYYYWRVRARVEGEKIMSDAHRELYEGEQAFLAADFLKARELLESGMKKYEKILADNPDLKSDDPSIEEGLLAQLFWREILQVVFNQPIPDEYPLKELWETEQGRLPSVQDEFNRRRRAQR